jgi:hypothetical protein
MISSLIPYYSGLLLGNGPSGSASTLDPASLGIDPRLLGAAPGTSSSPASAPSAPTPAAPSSPQAQELLADQTHVTGLGQLLSALNAFETSLQAVEQSTGASGGSQSVIPVQAAQQLVDAYNKLVTAISNLTGQSGALASDQVAKGLQMALGQTEGGVSSNALGPLAAIGITTNPDGALSLDQSAFQAAYAANPADTVGLLDQGAQALDRLAGQYTDAAGPVAATIDTLNQDIQVLQTITAGSDAKAQDQQQAVADDTSLMIAQMMSKATSDLTQQTFGVSNTQPTTLLPPGSTLSLLA